MKFLSNSLYVILLAGGVGSRLGGDRPKQFLELDGESLIRRSARRFRDYGFVKSIILVSHPDTIQDVEKDVDGVFIEGDRIVEGGATRHESGYNGIQALSEMGIGSGDYVFFHDVARPFFLYSELDAILKMARVHGSASLAVPCSDTLVKSQPNSSLVESSFSREGIWQVKTPQIASWDVISKLRQSKKSFDSENLPTDLCTWCLAESQSIGLVPTGDWNMKITRPGDWELAKVYLASLKATYPGFE